HYHKSDKRHIETDSFYSLGSCEEWKTFGRIQTTTRYEQRSTTSGNKRNTCQPIACLWGFRDRFRRNSAIDYDLRRFLDGGRKRAPQPTPPSREPVAGAHRNCTTIVALPRRASILPLRLIPRKNKGRRRRHRRSCTKVRGAKVRGD
uniref:Uncharacterized protein n=1 Tax=Anopheles atroparvus TaxID=41427 RepID=A0AAG5DM63_ANOAO